jgi:hypothetical protein
MIEGDDTAKAMRYSISVMALMLIAGYLNIVSHDTVTSILTLAAGYIMGKARTQTHYISATERKSGVE